MFNNFKQRSSGSNYIEYIFYGPFKFSKIDSVRIFTGEWKYGQQKYSIPIEGNLNLNSYENLTLTLIKSNAVLNFLELDLSISTYKDLIPYCPNKNLLFLNAPINLISNFLKEICISENKEEVKYGGNCSVCGEYDGYAPVTNGKCLCYKHFYPF